MEVRMIKRNIAVIIILLLFVGTFQLEAATIYVDLNGGGDYLTIQECIDIAVDGDTVLVADGTYTGNNNKNLTWDGDQKHITVKSENGVENCIIDCEENGRAFCFDDTAQDTTDVIEGFTLKNGYSWNGGCIYCYGTSPKIQNNIITNSVACGSFSGSGGGICCYYSSAIIVNNVIKDNNVFTTGFPGQSVGGGIASWCGDVIIKNNLIKNNETYAGGVEVFPHGGGIFIGSSSATIINNLIIENSAISYTLYSSSGGGIFFLAFSYEDCTLIVENNTIVDNYADYAGAMRLRGYAIIKNNICCNNSSEGISCSILEDSSVISHNNVWGHDENFVSCPSGIGDTSWGFNNNGTPCDSCYNIIEDPFFVSNSSGNYFLSQIDAGQVQQSLCVNAGDSSVYYYGLENYTTRTDLVPDVDLVDMGYHYPGEIVISVENNNSDNAELWLESFPNPVKGILSCKLHVHKQGNFNISLFNVKGQLEKTIRETFFSQGNYMFSLDMKDFCSGIYFLTLRNNDNDFKLTKKIIKLD